MKILVVAAHPDDEVLGCGGTIAQLAKNGHEIYVGIMGEGMTSRFPQREQADPAILKKLHAVSRRVAKDLGVREISILDLPDNRFDTVSFLEIVKIVEDWIGKWKPEIIYTHHGGDLNIDHRIVNRAVLTATRPVPGQSVREIYAFEIPSSTEWAFGSIEPVFRPNCFVVIDATLDVKKQALLCYDTETRSFPHPRSAEAMEVIARRWGSVVGKAAVEAFELIRAIR